MCSLFSLLDVSETLLRTPSVPREPRLLPLICKLLALFMSYFSWAMGISIASSRSWRVWEFKTENISEVFIGLWEAFYLQKLNISGSNIETPVYSAINSSWVISDEIWYGQDLMLLANFMKSIALIFASMALMIAWIRGPYPEFLRSCYNISIVFLCLSSVCTLVTVCWNYAVEFYGQTTLDFPKTFPVVKNMLTKKRMSYIFPLGLATALISVFSASIFLCESCCLKEWIQDTVKDVVCST